MPSRIGGSKPKAHLPKKSAKKGTEPLPHFGGKAAKASASRGGAPAGGNVSANRGTGQVGGGNVSANRGVAPAQTPTVSVSRGGEAPSQGPVSGGRFGQPVDTFNPGNVARGRWG